MTGEPILINTLTKAGFLDLLNTYLYTVNLY